MAVSLQGLTITPNAAGASPRDLAERSYWGRWTTPAFLPNAASNSATGFAFTSLQEGDTAYVESGELYICRSKGTDGGGDAQWQALNAPVSALTPIEIYVNSATGSDANPGTLALPLQTLDAAYDLVPPLLYQTYNIYLQGPGPYATAAQTRQFVGLRGNLNLRSLDFTTLASGTATGGSVSTVVDGGATFTPGALVGKTVRLNVAGAPGPYYRSIIDNDATTITFSIACYDLSLTFYNPGAGDTYEVLEPVTTLTVDVAETFGGLVAAPDRDTQFSLRLINLLISTETKYIGAVECRGTEIRGTVTGNGLKRAGASNPSFIVVPDAGNFAQDFADITDPIQAFGWGLNATDNGFFAPTGTQGDFYGFICAAGLQASVQSTMTLFGGRIYGDSTTPRRGLNIFQNSTTLVVTPAFLGANFIFEAIPGRDFLLAAVEADTGSFIEFSQFLTGRIATNPGVDAILSERGSTVNVLNSGPPISAGQYGLRSRRGGRIYYNSDPAVLVTAGVAVVAAGDTPQTAATLPTDGDIVIATTPPDLSIVQRVDT